MLTNWVPNMKNSLQLSINYSFFREILVYNIIRGNEIYLDE